jgi:hypothetical protein
LQVLKQPERWIPNDRLRVAKALEKFGASRIAGWTGSESEAIGFDLPPDPPWTWSRRKVRVSAFFKIINDRKIREVSEDEALSWWQSIQGDLTNEWQNEFAAARRWKECLESFRSQLAEGEIKSQILNKDGDYHDIPSSFWRSVSGEKALLDGFAEFKFVSELGYPYLTAGPIVFDAEFLYPELKLKNLEPEIAEFSIDGSKFPYLAFMIRAAKQAPFLSTGRTSKKVIEAWLKENWPNELGKLTESKIRGMATFLRRPEDERGGLHR